MILIGRLTPEGCATLIGVRAEAGDGMVCQRLGGIAVLTVPAVHAQRGAPQPSRPDNAQSLSHVNAARTAGWRRRVSRVPFELLLRAGERACAEQQRSGSRAVRLFDNLYAVGNSETTVYALTSSAGIVLLDAGFENKAEALEAQLRALQSRSRERQVHPAWTRPRRSLRRREVLSGQVRNKGRGIGGRLGFDQSPRRSSRRRRTRWRRGETGEGVVLAEGQPFQFGDLTITPVAIPGHTPGSLAFVFPVKDKGHDSNGRTLRRDGAHHRDPDDRRVEAVRAVDCALPRDGEADERRSGGAEPSDLRWHARQAGEVEARDLPIRIPL